jgi:hypothetical protein
MTLKIGNSDEINKNKPKLCKGKKGKIVNKLYCILLKTLTSCLNYIFFRKKTDMKFIILVSNLKEISPSIFSWKKKIYKKNYDAILLLKYDSAEKKILNYAYMLKNGVGRYNIFFLFLHKACWILLFVSFSYRIRQCFCSIPRFDLCFIHQQTISHMRKHFPEWVHYQVVWILHG